MCLIVDELPSNYQTYLIGKGFKLLGNDYRGYVTPFQQAKVSKSGWLFPKNLYKIEQSYIYKETISDGYIHYYNKNKNKYEKRYPCYAFGITAYESKYDEAVCLGMYIKLPHHDNKIEDLILSLMDGDIAKESVTKSKLINTLPRLKVVKDFLHKPSYFKRN